MKEVSLINYIQKARNAEHFQLYSSLFALATPELAEKYGLTTYRNVFATAFENENRAYLANQSYTLTSVVNEKDALCDRRFRAFDLAIQSKQLSDAADEAAAASRLAYAMKPYKGAPNKPQAENIAMVKDMVELFEEQYATDVETLGLTTQLANLKQVVEEFETALYGRADERLARVSVDNMSTIRPKVDAAFADFAKLFSACYLVAAYIDNDSEKAAELEEVIDSMNARILYYHDTLARRGIGTVSGTDTGGDEPTPEPVTPEITAVYQKEGGDPENPNRIERGEQTGVKYQGFTLKGADGTLEHVIGLVNDQDYIEWIKPETISNVTETGCEFTMVPDLTEGQYKVRIETYDGGSPLVVEYPEPITLW